MSNTADKPTEKGRPVHLGSGDLFGAFARLLNERGFQLARGTYHHGNGDILPTVVITRPATPEWSGVWAPWESTAELPGDVCGEDQAILEIAGEAIAKWDDDAHLFLPNGRDEPRP